MYLRTKIYKESTLSKQEKVGLHSNNIDSAFKKCISPVASMFLENDHVLEEPLNTFFMTIYSVFSIVSGNLTFY